MKKKNDEQKVMRKKGSLSICPWVKEVQLFTFENSWIWLDEPFEIFISDE